MSKSFIFLIFKAIVKFVLLLREWRNGRRTILRGWRPQGMGVQVPLPARKGEVITSPFLFDTAYLIVISKQVY